MPRRHHTESSLTTTPHTESDATARNEVQLYTPARAAHRLCVPESWLRRKAGTRSIPCTFVGRYLRFSEQNLHDIARDGNRPARRRSRP